ncbi:PREDICTED: uncharacterized protein LOC109239084 isoform X6 [Nicotiana attenuata]|uniref:uncharacterized protein LOC109239084 isoform X6 n=1 Tax=Nicotiana attenuata TaxID=49451 RepID=UPI000904B0F7|nr:PREDICTED: uncharacterized protein LOC109239084 isoform X6 [Nicotiana attenuata]
MHLCSERVHDVFHKIRKLDESLFHNQFSQAYIRVYSLWRSTIRDVAKVIQEAGVLDGAIAARAEVYLLGVNTLIALRLSRTPDNV